MIGYVPADLVEVRRDLRDELVRRWMFLLDVLENIERCFAGIDELGRVSKRLLFVFKFGETKLQNLDRWNIDQLRFS